ncbi:SDR family NAD(P)-dependent oxidoreductase [Cognatilysobacter lacus]|nr:SDR family NAD(P)-dependent oxidoreductase [Lysobacter lacus]
MLARTVVITGASSGLGRGVALALAAEGCNLVLAARRARLLEQLAEECGNAIAVSCDVGDPNAVEKLAAAAIAKFNRIDVWINNAGVAALGPFERIPLEDHLRVMQTNLGGAIAGSHAAISHFRKAGGGTLINIAAMLGRTPAPYYASYCATKYGIVGLCDALRQELVAQDATGIHVCAVLPMAADTPLYDHAANYTGHTLQPFPITDADEVVAAIVGLVNEPQDELSIGMSATAAGIAERLAQTLTHGMTGAMTQLAQMETAPEAPEQAGNLHRPIAIGTGVHGSILERMDVERNQRSR